MRNEKEAEELRQAEAKIKELEEDLLLDQQDFTDKLIKKLKEVKDFESLTPLHKQILETVSLDFIQFYSNWKRSNCMKTT